MDRDEFMKKARVNNQVGFWKAAKRTSGTEEEMTLPAGEFKTGFLDILKDYAGPSYDLDALFDPMTYGLKDKTSYKVIKELKDKRAAERSDTDPKEDIDYALMAFAKLWTMQFVDGRIPWNEYASREAEKANKAREKEDAERVARLPEMLKFFEEKKPEVEAKIKEAFDKVINEENAKMLEYAFDAIKMAEEINATKYDFTYDIKKRTDADVKIDMKELDMLKDIKPVTCKVDMSISSHDYSFNNPMIDIVFSVTLYGSNWGEEGYKVPTRSLKEGEYHLAMSEEYKEEKFNNAVDTFIKDYSRYIQESMTGYYASNKAYEKYSEIRRKKQELDEYQAAVDASKQAAIDAEAGRSTADFEALVDKAIRQVEGHAQSKAAEWRGSVINDGDSGLAYHQGLQDGDLYLMPYLGYCSWIAKDVHGYPISCKAGSSFSTVRNAAIELGYKGSDFKVVPTEQLEAPKKTFADSADYSDELIKDYDTEA